MQTLRFKIRGINQIRLNNPQSADPMNRYAIALKTFTNVHVSRRNEEHYVNMRNLEFESKLYWNNELGVYVPSSWLMEAIAKESFAKIKLAKAKVRSAVFPASLKFKLNYEGMDRVHQKEDLIRDESFRATELIKQGQVRIVKVFPQFNNWSIDFELEYDENIITEDDMRIILEQATMYNGFGDFRPTYGRCEIVEWNGEPTNREVA